MKAINSVAPASLAAVNAPSTATLNSANVGLSSGPSLSPAGRHFAPASSSYSFPAKSSTNDSLGISSH